MDFEHQITALAGLAGTDVDALVLVLSDRPDPELAAPLATLVANTVSEGDLVLKKGKLLYLHQPAGVTPRRVVLSVAGDASPKSFKAAVASGVGALKSSGAKTVGIAAPGITLGAAHAEAAVVAAADSSYLYTHTKPSATPGWMPTSITLFCQRSEAKPVQQGLRQPLRIGREPRIEHQLEFAGESLPAEPPVAGGARHQFSFEILLILFQERGDRSGGGLQGVALRGLAREQEQALVVERDRPPILANRRFEDRSRRASQVFLRRGHNTRNLRQPGDAVGDVRLLGKGGLGEKEVNAVADAVVVNARVLLERARVLGQPEGPLEVVFEDFVIDLAVARQPGVIDPAREFLQSRAGVGGPALTRLSGEIVEQGIETMVAQSRRFEWPAAEMFLEVMLEEIVESCIGVLSARRAGGFGHERESRQDCEC